ncbi:MAG: hypothetical protein JHC26_05635 [Thermofilum sp.]|jgi:hypothetical protein|uniref:hypothetical protein n=1 Tax=Thermofilum sp. TaxID=1961369 RepID=UPI002585EFFD|nr:hypothetical protein [Thermofilum sp.]MCI4408553.1 hypothetical protein [Thermofilum sp.]
MHGALKKKYYMIIVALFVLFTYPFAVFFTALFGLTDSLSSGDMVGVVFNLFLLVYGIAGFVSMYIIVTVTPQFALASRQQEQE